MDKYLDDIIFDEEKINRKLLKVNENLKQYIESKIMPRYSLNDKGHNQNHIDYVTKRAFEYEESDNVNLDMLYTCISFHDIACSIDRENHETLSAKIANEDKFLNNYFSKDDMKIICEAIEDHRASLEYAPRSIYGKILSSADRKIEIKGYLYTSMSFEKKKYPNKTMEEIIDASYEFGIKKFGIQGYAKNKIYVNDLRYKKFLDDMCYLTNNKDDFTHLAKMVYKEL